MLNFSVFVELDPVIPAIRISSYATITTVMSFHISDGFRWETRIFLVFKTLRYYIYSKTCLKWPLKNRQNKGLKDKW